ncbi:MAG: hypothetical protein AAF196_08815 [Planctomycetota bacterium]
MSVSTAPEGSIRRPSPSVVAISCLTSFAASVFAQEDAKPPADPGRWAITAEAPARVAVQYERDFDWDCDWAGQGPDPQRGVSYGGHPRRVQPVLLASELSVDRTHRERAPYDLFDVFPYLAFDLRTLDGGEIDRVFHRMPWVGDLEVTGTVRAMDQDGNQEMRLHLVSREGIDPLGDDDSFLRSLDHYIDETVDMDVVLRRRLSPASDATGSLVEMFQVALTGTVTRQRPGEEKLRFRVSGRELWTLESFVAPSASLRSRVQEAIDAARHYLEGEHLEHGNNTRRREEGRGNFQGPTLRGLELWAMARSGWTIDRPSMKESMDLLLDSPAEQPLTLAMRILAVDALHDRRGDTRRRPTAVEAGTPRQRGKRHGTLPAELGVRLDHWTRQLLTFADPEQLAKGRFVFRFASDGFESSQVNWVGLMALDVAEARGFDLPDELWSQAATWLCEHAIETGRPVDYQVEFEVTAFLGDEGALRSRRAAPLGFSRHAELDRYSVQGASTLESAAALALCRQRLGRADRDLKRRCDQVLDGVLAWMATTMTPRVDLSTHPIYFQDTPDLRLALPFALEGLGVQSLGSQAQNVRGFHARDWYFDTVNVLLPDQSKNGAFASTVIGTPAALMILRPRVDGALTGEGNR